MNTALGAGDPDLNPEGMQSRHAERDPRDLRPLLADDRRAPRESHRRPDQRARPRRDRRSEARGARDRDGLLPARRGRQRQHQGHLLQRHAGADGAPRRAPGAARRPVADLQRGRGVAADVPGVRPLPPHRHPGHRARRPADPRGRQGGHVVRQLQPRREPLRGSGPLRRAPQPRAPGVRRRRAALLPRRGAGPAGAQRAARGDARALSRRWRVAGRPTVRRVGVHQPAQDAAGAGLGPRDTGLSASRPRATRPRRSPRRPGSRA